MLMAVLVLILMIQTYSKQSSIFNQVIVNHYLNSTGNDDWFILTNVKDGLKYFERRGDQFEMDNDFDTENAKFKATARYSFRMVRPASDLRFARRLIINNIQGLSPVF